MPASTVKCNNLADITMDNQQVTEPHNSGSGNLRDYTNHMIKDHDDIVQATEKLVVFPL
jgi:hypothetical protein